MFPWYESLGRPPLAACRPPRGHGFLRQEYAWVQERWNGPQIEQLQRIVEQNVHIRRIRDPEEYEPTGRMLTTALESHSDLYRDAARLLRTRRELFDGDPSALDRLLRETSITPEDDETLLELFVLFRIIGTLEGMDSEVAQFETIATDRQEIARLRGVDDVEIVLYHDNSGKDQDLSRTKAVHTTALDVANTYFRDKSLRTHTGRPDLIVLEIDHGDQQDYLLTEVKNSTHTATIRRESPRPWNTWPSSARTTSSRSETTAVTTTLVLAGTGCWSCRIWRLRLRRSLTRRRVS